MLGLRKSSGIAIDLWQGDITAFVCDAMVNAANSELAGGSGVDGAIHKMGGPSIMEECRKIGSCEVGAAVYTSAGDLPARYVIHTVGPQWVDGKKGEEALLRSCFLQSLKLAQTLDVRHITFPAISTGAYRYPVEKAAQVAMSAVKEFIRSRQGSTAQPKRITFILHSREHYQVFQEAMFTAFPESAGK